MRLTLVLLFGLGLAPSARSEEKPVISEGRRTKDGLIVHKVTCAYQDGTTEIKVLLPDRLEKGKRYPVVYVLPVEAGGGERYGDGLAEIRRLDLHNKYGVICVLVTFAHLPWYADHPTNPRIRQETYVLDVVVPFIDKTYPAETRPAGRLLVGFSKSGWGASSLLLRHPQVFGKAAAWDAPLTEATPERFGMKEIFATQANFEKYRITALLDSAGARLGKEARLGLIGYSNFRPHHQQAHELMTTRGIAHFYQDVRHGPHTWSGGWLEDAFRWLMND